MIDIIQTILLIVIAWFIVTPKSIQFAGFFNKQRKIILDSCALIDGRIVAVINNRFLADELVIPQFIVNELQLLADGADSHKRERARFGLDIAHQLQDSTLVKVSIDHSVFPDIKTNDDKLITLTKKLDAVLCTTDYNLAKVAALESIYTLNINELAQSLRPISLPGETLDIKIIQKGSNRDQGVGYLEDGTMIVVDNAARHLGRTVPVSVTRMHQTVAGKMVFGQVREERPATAAVHAVKQAANNSSSRPTVVAPAHIATSATPQKQLHNRLQKPRKRQLI